MPFGRPISPGFRISEAVVDCAPMTRLLLPGLANVADGFGVLPLRPRTGRLQVFPGDAIDDDQVRAMLDELVARGLLRRRCRTRHPRRTMANHGKVPRPRPPSRAGRRNRRLMLRSFRPPPGAFMPASPSREIAPTMSNHDISLPAAMVSLARPAGRGRRVEVYPAAQPQDGPQVHEGPHWQVSGWLAQPQSAAVPAAISGLGAQAQTGAQVQGLQVQVVFIGERLRFGLRWAWCTLGAGNAIERRG